MVRWAWWKRESLTCSASEDGKLWVFNRTLTYDEATLLSFAVEQTKKTLDSLNTSDMANMPSETVTITPRQCITRAEHEINQYIEGVLDRLKAEIDMSPTDIDVDVVNAHSYLEGGHGQVTLFTVRLRF